MLARILSTVRRPGQDQGKCDRCSGVRQFTAEEGAVYLIDGTPVKCGENVSIIASAGNAAKLSRLPGKSVVRLPSSSYHVL